jgi:hypothetical protein
MNEKTLREIGIRHWADISGEFEGADLLLGNGFSLNFSALFNYRSLFEKFLDSCEPEDAGLFRRFDTTNFESIQEQLLSAKKVNELFGLPTHPIDPAIQKLRDGLIISVQQIHPLAQDIDNDALWSASEALDPFEDIFTLNYDLFLYQIIMVSVDRSHTVGVRRHNDYFWQRSTDEFLEFMDFDNLPNKHVYYLHGALFLFPGYRLDYHNDLKIRRGNQPFEELIEVVSTKIQRGILPLFVSEGEPEDKMLAISRSPYLKFAYRKLEESERPLTIYGWSASTQDNHILSALNPRRTPVRRPLAVSVYIGDKSRIDLELPPIGWQLFILGSSQSDLTAFPSSLNTYATRLLAEPVRGRGSLHEG